jgi:hypothetical protein
MRYSTARLDLFTAAAFTPFIRTAPHTIGEVTAICEFLSDLALELFAATAFIEASALDSAATGLSWQHQIALCSYL